ncbi:uncharacterized protein AKAW2_70658A [Aspergillus luchuensis]|uniref:Uncharacterized protein n=1 Tax=Aspergillus kawachii TaxID=1069201 RepID=A0A146FVN4_ASPKA|nr:uncharacterized protein AKAW2_70658A [Aspergillus luchuensis]BCS03780.1 hypothetical protein AKAW2_70658A [Aspergillus luchuensis]BCS15393.1 hypothetical protein ALUC_70626A [Aspergillus luchuensis]GAT28931.1 hypothetical protein RIB2604_02701160 [Aspergillus luchuensis]
MSALDEGIQPSGITRHKLPGGIVTSLFRCNMLFSDDGQFRLDITATLDDLTSADENYISALALTDMPPCILRLRTESSLTINEPGSSLSSRTRVKTLAYDTILANSRFFGNDLDLVPRRSLTVGIQTIMDAREVVIVATGAHKTRHQHG